MSRGPGTTLNVRRNPVYFGKLTGFAAHTIDVARCTEEIKVTVLWRLILQYLLYCLENFLV